MSIKTTYQIFKQGSQTITILFLTGHYKGVHRKNYIFM